MSRLFSVALAGLVLAPQMLIAQAPVAGERIRVRQAGEASRVGTLVALANDTLAVRWANDSATARLPIGQVSQLEVSRGSQRRVMSRLGRGFMIGAGAGAVLGGVGGAMEDCEGELFCVGPAGGALIGGVVFGATGAVIGALTGLAPSERWERARLDPRRVTLLLPTRIERKGIGLAVAF
jgi:hypothetical protein